MHQFLKRYRYGDDCVKCPFKIIQLVSHGYSNITILRLVGQDLNCKRSKEFLLLGMSFYQIRPEKTLKILLNQDVLRKIPKIIYDNKFSTISSFAKNFAKNLFIGILLRYTFFSFSFVNSRIKILFVLSPDFRLYIGTISLHWSQCKCYIQW